METDDSAKQDQARLLDRLAACETAIAQLYEYYARQLPESRSVWTSVSEDEYQHANALRSLHNVLRRYVFSNLNRFRPAAVTDTWTRSVRP